MVVNPALPTKTLPEFIAYAKANPGRSIWHRPVTGLRITLLASCSK